MKKEFAIVAMLLLAIVLGCAVASAIPVTIDEVKVDGDTLVANDTVRLAIERDEDFDVRVRLTAQQNMQDVEVEAFISGYEYNDEPEARLSDVTAPFDLDANTSVSKSLQLKLPADADEDDYKIRIIVSDRYGEELIRNYNIKIDAKRHSIVVQDVILNPSSEVRAGSALLVSARIENYGGNDEDDVKVTASMPALGISASDYIDDLDNDEQKSSEELYLRIPRCSNPGIYDVVVSLSYNRGRGSDKKTVPISVTEDETCNVPAAVPQPPTPTTIISLGSVLETSAQGGTMIYPITLTNTGNAARSYTLTLSGTDWADIKLSPASLVVVDAGKSQTVNVFTAVDQDAKVGPQTMTVTVSSGNEKLQDVTLTANVTKAQESGWESAKRALVVALIVLVALLVILGLIIGISRMKDEGEGAKPQTYY